MQLSKILPWIVAPLVCGVAAYVYHSVQWKREWLALTQSAPLVEFPQHVDLGECERGQPVEVRFAIVNRGGAELFIDQIQANCACLGLEREINGKFTRLETLKVQPRESVPVVVRITVQGEPGAPMSNALYFRTNDPTVPQAYVEMPVSRVLGGIVTSPRQVVFGTVIQGTGLSQILEIRDHAHQPRRVQRVESSNPDRFKVRFISSENGSSTPVGAEGKLIGRVEIVVPGERPGAFEGAVRISLK